MGKEFVGDKFEFNKSFKKCSIINSMDWTEYDIHFDPNSGSYQEMCDSFLSISESKVDFVVFEPSLILVSLWAEGSGVSYGIFFYL